MSSLWVSFLVFALLQRGRSETQYCSNQNGNCVCEMDGLCKLYCLGKDACKGSDKLLGCRAGYPCEVNCNASGSENSCVDATIDGSMATDVLVKCVDTQACLNTRVKCGSGSCRVLCSGGSDSEGSECKGMRLDCASSYCSIECVDASSNTCSNVRVTVDSTTRLFECRHPGINNFQCAAIDAYQSPFIQTTLAPTPDTTAPTLSPTQLPTVSPSVAPSHTPTTPIPTKATASPTVAPSAAPTRPLPTQKPSAPPTQSPFLRPTAAPTTPSPTRATSPPSVSPTVSPTKATKAPTVFYYVVDNVGKPTPHSPTDSDSSQSNSFMTAFESTWLYGVVAGGITLCCFILICIRCQMKRMRTKKIAAPAPSQMIAEFRKNRFPQKPSLYHMQVQSGSQLHDVPDAAPSPLIQPPPPTEAVPEDILRQYKKKKRRHRQSSDKSERRFRISSKYEHDGLLEEGIEEDALDDGQMGLPAGTDGLPGVFRTNDNHHIVDLHLDADVNGNANVEEQKHADEIGDVDDEEEHLQVTANLIVIEEENYIADDVVRKGDSDNINKDEDDDDDIHNDEPSKSHESDESDDSETQENEDDDDDDGRDQVLLPIPMHESRNSRLLHFKSLGSMHSFISEMNMNSEY